MISVVIPTLDAEAGLERTLVALGEAGQTNFVREVIICDGGSSDATLAIARRYKCRIISTDKVGRGAQLRAGGQAARGDWLLFLHADTVLEPGWERCVEDFIGHAASEPAAAVFRFKLNDTGWKARALEKIVALRCRLAKLPYGDQGLVMSRCFYAQIGGYSALPLMEDVEIIRRIGGRRLTILPAAAETSAVRYIQEGYFRRTLRNLFCLGLWFLGFSPDRISRTYG